MVWGLIVGECYAQKLADGCTVAVLLMHRFENIDLCFPWRRQKSKCVFVIIHLQHGHIECLLQLNPFFCPCISDYGCWQKLTWVYLNVFDSWKRLQTLNHFYLCSVRSFCPYKGRVRGDVTHHISLYFHIWNLKEFMYVPTLYQRLMQRLIFYVRGMCHSGSGKALWGNCFWQNSKSKA